MDNRRSRRSRKKVKYAKFSESSDDDFEEKNASVTKKQKGEKNGLLKSNKKKPERKEANSAASDVASRPSVMEKVFQRHLQIAIKISEESVRNKNDFQEENVLSKNKQKGETKLIPHVKKFTSPKSSERKSLPRSSDSEKTALQKDVVVTLQPYQKDKKSKDDSDHIKANSENYNKIEAEQEENSCNIELTNREVKQKNKNQVDTKEVSDVEYTISSEEDENRDDKDWKENSDESDDGKSKSIEKSQVKMKKEKEVCVNHSRKSARQAKKECVQTHLTAKSKVINYCAKKPLNLPAVKLRLGLSRKASIKPLHSTVKVQQ